MPTRHSQLEKLEGREMMASQINNLYFVNDTGTVGDGQSSDIRIGGNVSFTGTYTGQTLKVEFDHNNDGTVDGYVNASYMGSPFEYNPRTADASLNTFTGSLPMRVRVEELDSMGQSQSIGSWISFPITVLAPEPEIDVQDPGPYGMSNTSLPDNTGSLSFGSTAQGTPVSKTLNIKNLGQGPLSINIGSFSLPAGYTLVTPPASSIAAGSYSSFVIRMDATSPGTPGGVMTFTSNDADEGTYHLSLSGTVTGLSFSVNNLQLVTDNGYSSTDKVTSDPTVTGSVSYTGSYSGGTIRVEFDHNNDGVMEGYVNASPSMPFQYDARTAQPSLSTYNGTFTLRYRVVVLDMMSQPTYTGSWSSFVMTLENNSQPVLDVQDASNSTSIANNTGSVSFGTVSQGASVTKSFTIRNTGSATMTVNVGSFTLPAGFVLATSPSSTVAANGGSTTFSVRMDGTTAGSKSGRLTFTTNSTTATYDIGLSGTVNALNYAVNNLTLVNDTWINGDFITSDPRVTGTVTQTGTYSASRIDVEFDHNDDGVKEGAVTYASVGMSWQYDPRTSQPSLATATGTLPLRYRVVAYDTMSQAVFTGSWASLPIQLDNTPQPEIDLQDPSSMGITSGSGSVYFGSTTQGSPLTKTFTIRNTGPGALTVNPASLTVPSGFTVVTPPASTVSANGGTTTFTVRLDATTPGTASGTISFTNSDADEGTYAFSVSGTVNTSLAEVDLRDSSGTSLAVNATYNLGNATIGQSITKTLTIFNSGSGNLTVGTPVLSGSSAFSIVSSPMATVSPGSSTTVTIQFTPNLSGQVNGTLTFATNDADENPYVCNLVATGAAAPSAIVIGDMRLVSDTGTSSTDRVTSDPRLTGTIPLDANLSGGRVSIEFDHHGSGTASGNILAYSPGEVFTYNPVQAEPSLASFVGLLDVKYRTVLFNAQNQAVASSNWVSYPINLEAAAAPKLVVTGAGGTTIIPQVGSFDFGSTPQGTPVSQIFAIKNTGTSNLVLNLSSFQVPSGFTLTPPTVSTVVPNGEVEFTLRLSAAATGIADGTVQFSSNDVENGTFSFRVHGDTFLNTSAIEVRKPNGALIVSGSTIDLGNTYLGQAITQSFTILNTGTTSLALDPANILLTPGMTVATPFATSVAPNGGSTILIVQYTASAVGSVIGSLSFATNDPAHPTFQVQWLAETTDPAAGSSTTVSGMRLAFDSGASDTDKQTYDPRLIGRLGGSVSGGVVEVQFDHNGDGVPEGFITVTNQSGPGFTYDPRGVQPNLSNFVGNVSLKYRAVLKDLEGGILRSGDWQTFSFTMVARPTIPNLEISQMALVQDSGSSTSDRITTNPTLFGIIRGVVSPGSARVEFDHNGDGIVDGFVNMLPDKPFTYDPRDTVPAFANQVGAQVISFRLVKLAADGTIEATGAWDGFGFTLVAPPASQITVGTLGLVNDNGNLTTSAPIVKATHSGFLYDAMGGGTLQLEVDSDSDNLPNDRVESAGESGEFQYIPAITSYGSKTLQVRFREWAPSLGVFLYGPWSSITFTVVPVPAGVISDLKLTNDTGVSDTDKISLDGTVEGKLSGSEEIAFQTIHIDLNGDNTDELTATTDEYGNFSFNVSKLASGAITSRVRASRLDYLSNSVVYGPWATFSFVLESVPLPVLSGLTLLQDTGTPNDLITSNPTVTGQIATLQAKAGVTIQFELNNNGVVVAQTKTDDTGNFVYRPLGISEGPVLVRARVAAVTPQGTTQFGPWVSLAYTFLLPVGIPASITGLGLVRPTEADSGGTFVTNDPAIAGIAREGGAGNAFAAGIVIEVDQNNDGQADGQSITDLNGKFQFVPVGLAMGVHTLQVRTKSWDYKSHSLIIGPWQPITFTLAAKTNAPPVLSEIGLLADTGLAGDLITANTMLVGKATNDGSVGGLSVEVDTTGDGIADGLAYTGADGSFTYEPVGMTYGTHTVMARAIEWNEEGGQYQFSAWKPLSFTYENAADSAAQIVEFHVVGSTTTLVAEPESSSEPALAGRIVNEYYLAGITVEFDWNNDGLVDTTAVTDRLGNFERTLEAMPNGTTSIRARTWELNNSTGASLRSAWSTITIAWSGASNNPPTVLTFQQAISTPEAGLVLAGTVANDTGVSGLVVQFDHDGDGIVEGSAITNSQGAFTYVPQGLATGSITIRARAQETSLQGITLTGPWVSLAFSYTTPADQVAHIDSIGLLNDSGASASDNATADGTVRGHVANSMSGTFVEYDINSDGIVDGTAIVDSQGFFQFAPSNISEGYISVNARVQSSTSANDWTRLNFVYSSQPDSSQVQALASAYQTFNSNWATAQANYRTGLNTIDRNFRLAKQNAEQAYQDALLAATGTHQQAVSAAKAAYAAVYQAAQQTYQAAIEAANVQFATNLANFSGDKTSFRPLDFSLSDVPPDNRLTIPSDADQVTAPAQEYDGGEPTYDFGRDDAYQALLAQYKQEEESAVEAANSTFREVSEQLESDYKNAVAPIYQRMVAAIAAATAAFNAERAQNAITKEQLFDLKAKSDKYRKAVALENQTYEKLTDQIKARYTALQSAVYDELWQVKRPAIEQALATQSAPLNMEALMIDRMDPTKQARLNEIYDLLRGLQLTHDTDIADSDISFAYEMSKLARERAFELAEAKQSHEDQLTDLSSDYKLELMKANAWDDQKRIAAETKQSHDILNAKTTYSQEMIAPDSTKSSGMSAAAEARDNKISNAATDRWMKGETAKPQFVEAWNNALNTPGSNHQLALTESSATYSESLAPYAKQRNQADNQSKYNQQRSDAQKFADLLTESIGLKAAQKHSDIDSFATLRLAALPVHYGDGTEPLTGRDVDMLAEDRSYRKGLSLVDMTYAKQDAENYQNFSDGDAYNDWAAAIDIAEAKADKQNSGSALQSIIRGIEKTNELDNAANSLAFEKRTAEISRDRKNSRTGHVASNNDAVIAITISWNKQVIGAQKIYDKATASHLKTFEVAFAEKWLAFADGTADVEQTKAEELNANVKGLANATSGLLKSQIERDAHSDSEFKESVASQWLTKVANWAQSLQSHWSTYQKQLAELNLTKIVSSDSAQESYIQDTNDALLSNVERVNDSVEKANVGTSKAVKDNSKSSNSSLKDFLTDLAESRLELLESLADLDASEAEGIEGENEAVAKAIVQHWLDRNNDGSTARYVYEVAVANANSTQKISRINDRAELDLHTIDSATYNSRRLVAVNLTISTLTTAEGVRRTSVATTEYSRVVADAQQIKTWISNVDDRLIQGATEERDAIASFSEEWKVKADTLSTENAEAFAKYQKDIVKVQRDIEVERQEADVDLQKAYAPLTDALGIAGDAATDTYREGTSLSRSEYEIELLEEHRDKLISAWGALSSVMRRQNNYEVSAANSDIDFAISAMAAKDAYEKAISVANGNGGNSFDFSDLLDDQLAESVQLANARQGLADRLADINKDRSIREQTAADSTFSRTAVAAANLSLAITTAQAIYDKALAEANATWTSTAALAEKIFYGTISYSRPAIDTENVTVPSDPVIPQVTESTPALVTMRQSKQVAADVYSDTEFEAAKTLATSLVNSIIAAVIAVKGLKVEEATEVGDARVSAATANKTENDTATESETTIETPHHSAQRGYNHAAADFDLSKTRTSNHLRDDAEDVFNHAMNVARIAQATTLATATATIWTGQKQDIANQLSAWGASANIDQKFASASATAIAQWFQNSALSFSAYVHSVTTADAARSEAITAALRAQRYAEEDADDAFETSTRPIEDAADDARFAAERQLIEETSAYETQFIVNAGAAQNTYDVAVAGIEEQELADQLLAKKQRMLANIKPISLVGPFENLLSFSDDGKDVEKGIPVGPNEGSDGYPFTAGSGGTSPPSSEGDSPASIKAEQVGIAQARFDRIVVESDAKENWFTALADYFNGFTRDRAESWKENQIKLAQIERDRIKAIAPFEEIRQNAYSDAKQVEWMAETITENVERYANITASNAWQTASYTHAATVTALFAQTMQLPWTDYQAESATLELDWWANVGAPETALQVNVKNGADVLYQSTANNAYDLWSRSVNQATRIHAIALADVDYQRAVDRALSDAGDSFADADAIETWNVALGTSEIDLTRTLAQLDLDFSLGDGSSEDVATRNAAQLAAQVEAKARIAGAIHAYNVSRTVGDGVLLTAEKSRQLNVTIGDNEATNVYQMALTAATLEYYQAFYAAYLAQTNGYFTVDAEYQERLASSHSQIIADAIIQSSNPWLSYDSHVSVARASFVQSTILPYATQLQSTAVADVALKLAQLEAEKDYENAILAASHNLRYDEDLAAYTKEAALAAGSNLLAIQDDVEKSGADDPPAPLTWWEKWILWPQLSAAGATSHTSGSPNPYARESFQVLQRKHQAYLDYLKYINPDRKLALAERAREAFDLAMRDSNAPRMLEHVSRVRDGVVIHPVFGEKISVESYEQHQFSGSRFAPSFTSIETPTREGDKVLAAINNDIDYFNNQVRQLYQQKAEQRLRKDIESKIREKMPPIQFLTKGGDVQAKTQAIDLNVLADLIDDMVVASIDGKLQNPNELLKNNAQALSRTVQGQIIIDAKMMAEAEAKYWQSQGRENFSFYLHTGLSLLGFVPVVGTLADLMDATLYAVEGDSASAAFSFLAAIPGAGDTVAAAAKFTKGVGITAELGTVYARTIVRNADAAVETSKVLDDAVATILKEIDEIPSVNDVATRGLKDKLVAAVEEASAKLPEIKSGVERYLATVQKFCFAAGTPILTPSGEKVIEEFKVGDEILSRPEDNLLAPVVKTLVEKVYRLSAPILEVDVGGQIVRTTAEHPFFVLGRGWIKAGDLNNGDLLLGQTSSATPVLSVRDTGINDIVYSLRVAEHHTYFVGGVEWGFDIWVHNAYAVEKLGNEYVIKNTLTQEILKDSSGKLIGYATESDALNVALAYTQREASQKLLEGTVHKGATAELLAQIQQPAQLLVSQLASLLRRKAGFSDEGVPLIIDSNSMRRGMAEALREKGYNVRTVSEIFGVDPGDPAIASLAEKIGGRVLTNNMRDFGRNIAIRIDPRAKNVKTWIDLIEKGLQ